MLSKSDRGDQGVQRRAPLFSVRESTDALGVERPYGMLFSAKAADVLEDGFWVRELVLQI